MDEFIPARAAIRPADTVNWTPGFHTVKFPAETNLPLFRFVCETAGQDRPFRVSSAGCNLEYEGNLRYAAPSGPPGRPYTGGFYNFGILVLPRSHPWTAPFPKSGTFRYDCLIHPGMDGSITVR